MERARGLAACHHLLQFPGHLRRRCGGAALRPPCHVGRIVHRRARDDKQSFDQTGGHGARHRSAKRGGGHQLEWFRLRAQLQLFRELLHHRLHECLRRRRRREFQLRRRRCRRRERLHHPHGCHVVPELRHPARGQRGQQRARGQHRRRTRGRLQHTDRRRARLGQQFRLRGLIQQPRSPGFFLPQLRGRRGGGHG